MKTSRVDLVTVARFGFFYEAQIAQLALQAEGIPVFINGEEIVRMDWLLGRAVGDVQVDVPSEYEERAREILDTISQSRKSRTSDEKCLACGAVMSSEATTCTACGWTFAETATEVTEEDDSFNEPLQ